MRLGNSLRDYTQAEIDAMGQRIQSWLETLQETNATLDAQFTQPSEPAEGDNVIHLDMRPFAEFQRTLETPMPFHEIIDHYERWNDTLWELVHVNVGNYKSPKVVEFIMKLRFMVCTFQNFFDKPKEPIPG
jgi:hypothetical protein